MADNASPTPSVTTITLDNGPGPIEQPGAVGAGAQDATPGATSQEAAGAPAKAQDPDALLLELNRRNRVLTQREQALQKQLAAQKTGEGERAAEAKRYAKFADLQKLAQSDPYAAAAELATLIGIDTDGFAEAVVTKAAGGDTRKLSAEERVAKLEQERETERAARAKADDEARTAKEKADAAAREQAQYTEYFTKTGELLEKSGKFPLICSDDAKEREEHLTAVLDVQALAWSEGQRLTEFAAANFVEKALREKAQRLAQRAGLTPAQQAAQDAPAAVTPTPTLTQTTHSQTARAVDPRTQQGLSPIVATPSAILSDEEIAADWKKRFQPASFAG